MCSSGFGSSLDITLAVSTIDESSVYSKAYLHSLQVWSVPLSAGLTHSGLFSAGRPSHCCNGMELFLPTVACRSQGWPSELASFLWL